MFYYRLMEDLDDHTPYGIGGAGARWHHKGVPMIYATNTTSLSFMEFVSIKGAMVMNTAFKMVTYDIDYDIPRLDLSDLPSDWMMDPHPISTKNMGSRWVMDKTSPFLRVPTCRIPLSAYPTEHNLLINPEHPEMAANIRVVDVEKVHFRLQ